MGFGIRMAEHLAKQSGVDEDKMPLTLDDVRNDDVGKYLLSVHCADCDESLINSKIMTGTELVKNWLLIVASSPLTAPKCPKGCPPTASDCNAHTKLRIRKATNET